MNNPCFDKFRAGAALAVFSLFLIAGPAGAAGETTIDGVLHVQNGAAPANGTETVILDEMWRAGGDSDSDVFFGLITRVVTDKDGRIYLLDPQQATVHVFSSEGEALDPIFRRPAWPVPVHGQTRPAVAWRYAMRWGELSCSPNSGPSPGLNFADWSGVLLPPKHYGRTTMFRLIH